MLYWMVSAKVYTHPKALYGWGQVSPICHSPIIPKWTIQKGLACHRSCFVPTSATRINQRGKEESLMGIDV